MKLLQELLLMNNDLLHEAKEHGQFKRMMSGSFVDDKNFGKMSNDELYGQPELPRNQKIKQMNAEDPISAANRKKAEERRLRTGKTSAQLRKEKQASTKKRYLSKEETLQLSDVIYRNCCNLLNQKGVMSSTVLAQAVISLAVSRYDLETTKSIASTATLDTLSPKINQYIQSEMNVLRRTDPGQWQSLNKIKQHIDSGDLRHPDSAGWEPHRTVEYGTYALSRYTDRWMEDNGDPLDEPIETGLISRPATVLKAMMFLGGGEATREIARLANVNFMASGEN